MEPVPETERLEDFKPAPRPSLRLQSPTTPTRLPRSNFGPMSPLELDQQQPQLQQQPLKRPFNLRRSTDPTALSPKSPLSFGSNSSFASTGLAYRPRTTSPLTFSNQHPRVAINHGRSKSHLGLSMSRTQSMPGVNGAGHFLYSPSSPTNSPQRTRIPKRNPDDMFPTSPVRTSVLESSPRFNRDRSISPVSHASVTPFPLMGPALGSSPVPIPVSASPPASAAYSSSPLAPSPLAAAPQITMARVRPASPLRNPPPAASSASASILSSPVSLGRSVNSSLSTSTSSSFDNLYSTNHSNLSISSLASSSIPSTPTSTRSRSPSVSSLETIPDSPDAEEAAVEADRIAQLKAAAEAAAKGDSVTGGADQKPAKESRGGRGFRDKRKRWSVCGAERRGDLDLETIWED